ncbi:MAG: helix-turn-helix domain-containing protein [Oscillospiraceae bacterium]|nr:helix-turn-helix domain-containing protein [Oscillospiraceae bacterium]
MKIADKIHYLKNRDSITSEELSLKSGVPIGTINKILSGETKNPTGKTAAKIAKVFGEPVQYLIDDEITIEDASQSKSGLKEGKTSADSLDRETVVTELYSWLCSIGFIGEGEDITGEQLLALKVVSDFLRSAFGK